jgi:hypothetical protein
MVRKVNCVSGERNYALPIFVKAKFVLVGFTVFLREANI